MIIPSGASKGLSLTKPWLLSGPLKSSIRKLIMTNEAKVSFLGSLRTAFSGAYVPYESDTRLRDRRARVLPIHIPLHYT